jgi:hypothetical protein
MLGAADLRAILGQVSAVLPPTDFHSLRAESYQKLFDQTIAVASNERHSSQPRNKIVFNESYSSMMKQAGLNAVGPL